MYLYRIFSEDLYSDEFGNYIGYGIEALDGMRIVASVSDISTDKEMVEKLCRDCTELGLCPRQLENVVEDKIT